MRHVITTLLFCTAAAAAGQSSVIGTDEFFQVGGSYWRDHYDQLPPVLAQDLLASGTAGYVLDLAPLNNAFLYTTDSLICDVATSPYFWFADYYDTANVMLEVWDELGNDAMYLFLEEPGRVQYVGGAPNGSFNEIVWQQFLDNVFRLELEDGISHGFAHTETIDGFWNDASGSDFHYTTGTRVLTADGVWFDHHARWHTDREHPQAAQRYHRCRLQCLLRRQPFPEHAIYLVRRRHRWPFDDLGGAYNFPDRVYALHILFA